MSLDSLFLAIRCFGNKNKKPEHFCLESVTDHFDFVSKVNNVHMICVLYNMRWNINYDVDAFKYHNSNPDKNGSNKYELDMWCIMYVIL